MKRFFTGLMMAGCVVGEASSQSLPNKQPNLKSPHLVQQVTGVVGDLTGAPRSNPLSLKMDTTIHHVEQNISYIFFFTEGFRLGQQNASRITIEKKLAELLTQSNGTQYKMRNICNQFWEGFAIGNNNKNLDKNNTDFEKKICDNSFSQ